MRTHNVCFYRGIRKIFSWYSLLSRAMYDSEMLEKIKPEKKINHTAGIWQYNFHNIRSGYCLHTRMHTPEKCNREPGIILCIQRKKLAADDDKLVTPYIF